MMALSKHARNVVLGSLVGATLSACTGRGSAPTSVLRTEDFIADPATLPTATTPSPVQATAHAPRDATPPRPIFTVEQASEGIKDVSIKAGAPLPVPAGPFPIVTPSDSVLLVDAKIGEINGHPIRVDDMFDFAGDRLAATSRTRRLSATEWKQTGRDPRTIDLSRDCTRDEWRTLAESIFRKRLDALLQDEVLTAEARATLKPEEQAGLRNFVREASESRRRATGGSRAELERQLRAKNQTAGRFAKDIETSILIQTQIEDKFKSRLKTSWKDVRLYYERNQQMYRPPPAARFRVIQVATENADAIAALHSGLAAKRPFIELASLPINEYKPTEGGLFPDSPFTGEFSKGDFFAAAALNDAARQLKPGASTPEPIERLEQGGKKTLTWLWLEAIIDNTRPLSDPNVQMEITKKLDDDALGAAVGAYIERLKGRASFTDIETMTDLLVEIASDRYWPGGS